MIQHAMVPPHGDTTALQRQFTEGSHLNDLARRMKIIGVDTNQKARAAHGVRLNAEIEASRRRFGAVIGDDTFEIPEEVDETDTDGEQEDIKRLMNGAKRLQALFFGRFKVKPTVFSKNSGEPSLDENALKNILATPAYSDQIKEAVRALLLYRENQKTYSTYVQRLDPDFTGKKGSLLFGGSTILHANWSPLQARTGRWSCADPNLMNVQKQDGDRAGMRDMLRARSSDRVFIEADYKQLEVRIIAALAGCDALIEAFNRGEDIYSFIAEDLFRTKRDKWSAKDWKKKRGMAKIFVLASNYGGGIPVIHAQMVLSFPEITPKMCEGIQKRFFESYPEIPAFQNAMFWHAKKNGYVLCPISGRMAWFYLNRIKPTEAANYPIQGSAADIMNPASIRLDKALDWNLEWLIMQIHDALYIESLVSRLDRNVRAMKDNMEGMIKLGSRTVKFDVDVMVGQNWGEMKPFEEACSGSHEGVIYHDLGYCAGFKPTIVTP